MDGIIAALLAIVVFWGVFGLVMRLFQDLPMGYNTMPPGPAYEDRSAVIIDRQRRFVQTWLRQWPVAAIMFGVAVVLIIVK
jgi:hypothetical protein